MRFLLDENTHGDLGRALTDLGHDTAAVRRTTSDEMILAQCVAENRVLITHDRDFGQLIVIEGHPHRGVLYLRLSSTLVDFMVERIQAAIEAGYPSGAFVVVRDQAIRQRR
jgi:predicted nuclease of predicted toxin-antitoxin system